jgi:hypothetical protein
MMHSHFLLIVPFSDCLTTGGIGQIRSTEGLITS